MINFVIALQAEARPIIEQLKLKKIQTWQPFPIYESTNHRLIISGIGKCNSAAATAWLASLTTSTSRATHDIWLNLGIAGHKDQTLGKLMCCHKITEQSTKKSWYPVQIKSPLKSSCVLTLDQASTSYTDDLLYDMEASGFYATALRFTTSELAQSLKIVSDNELNAIGKIDKNVVVELVSDNTKEIVSYANQLVEFTLGSVPPATHELQQLITDKWRFTVTQSRQLQRLLQKYIVLTNDQNDLYTELESTPIDSASLVLELLRNKLDQSQVVVS